MHHHFTVDVEEYFHASAMEAVCPRARWERLETRVERGVDEILDILAGAGHQRGTFFVLGWVADRNPALVRRIAAAGHEIASHGWAHRKLTTLTPAEFRRSVRRSKALLEDVTGRPVLGYRAPSFSVVPDRRWALDVLLEEGYRYDSSVYPIRRPGYGYPGADRDPFWVVRPSGTLLELPPATIDVGSLRIPAGGGAYLRHFPYALIRAALRSCAARGVPGMVYIHPWELDAGQPRMPVGWLTRTRHYRGIETAAPKLRRLVAEFTFRPVADALPDELPVPAPEPARAQAAAVTFPSPAASPAST